MAGLHDTGGHFFEFVNMLIVRKIFSIANKVRFLVPITDKQIDDGRGRGLVQQIEILLEVFKGSSLEEIQEAVQPVVTKVDPRNDQFDIDIIISKSFQILQTHLSNYAYEELALRQNVIGVLEEKDKECKNLS